MTVMTAMGWRIELQHAAVKCQKCVFSFKINVRSFQFDWFYVLAPFSMWNSGVESNSNANFHAIINPQPQSAFQVGGPTTVAPASAAAAVPRPCNNNNKTMTAAMFAQTKFGSTKLKNHTKRSSRLSPTEGFSRCKYERYSKVMGAVYFFVFIQINVKWRQLIVLTGTFFNL